MAHRSNLSSSTILIFGGTSGIGFAIANMALSNNATVIISGSTPQKVAAKVALLRSYYPSLPTAQTTGHALDLHDTAALEANLTSLFETVTEAGTRPINHIAFTAGEFIKTPKISDVSLQNALSGPGIRFTAPLFIAKLLATGKYMPRSRSSSLTVTGGTNTKKPLSGWAVAAAWGAAIEGLTRGLAVDLAPIRVNIVEPGAIRTELLERFLAGMSKEEVEGMERFGGLVGGFGYPEDTAEAYGWLMRDRFVTGTVASTDGGRLLV